jgi:N-acetyl-anhydromuramyl-L-alanine amidase AmpD
MPRLAPTKIKLGTPTPMQAAPGTTTSLPGEYIPCHPECVRKRDTRWNIDRIVVHTAEGTLAGTVTWFQRSAAQRGQSYAAATHYVIGRDGRIVRMAEETDRLIHCGSSTQPGWNDRAIGIELEAWTGHSAPPSSIKFPRDDFPEALLVALRDLISGICARHNIPRDAEHIVGHGSIPGQTHTDPGAAFPWAKIL